MHVLKCTNKACNRTLAVADHEGLFVVCQRCNGRMMLLKRLAIEDKAGKVHEVYAIGKEGESA